jgi:hypothetical protein
MDLTLTTRDETGGLAQPEAANAWSARASPRAAAPRSGGRTSRPPHRSRLSSCPLTPASAGEDARASGQQKARRPNGLAAGARAVNKLSISSWFAGSGAPLRNGPSRVKDLSTTVGGNHEFAVQRHFSSVRTGVCRRARRVSLRLGAPCKAIAREAGARQEACEACLRQEAGQASACQVQAHSRGAPQETREEALLTASPWPHPARGRVTHELGRYL